MFQHPFPRKSDSSSSSSSNDKQSPRSSSKTAFVCARDIQQQNFEPQTNTSASHGSTGTASGKQDESMESASQDTTGRCVSRISSSHSSSVSTSGSPTSKLPTQAYTYAKLPEKYFPARSTANFSEIMPECNQNKWQSSWQDSPPYNRPDGFTDDDEKFRVQFPDIRQRNPEKYVEFDSEEDARRYEEFKAVVLRNTRSSQDILRETVRFCDVLPLSSLHRRSVMRLRVEFPAFNGEIRKILCVADFHGCICMH